MLREWLRAAVIPAALVGLAGAAGPPSPRTPTEEPPAAPGSHPLPAGVIARIGTRLYGGGLSPHFSHDGKQIAVTTGYVARVLDIATGRKRFSDQINPTNIGGPAVVRFAMSGDVIAACAPHGQPVHVWRIAPNGTVTGPMKYIPPDHRDPPAGLPTATPRHFCVGSRPLGGGVDGRIPREKLVRG